jgi:hypothetical protein
MNAAEVTIHPLRLALLLAALSLLAAAPAARLARAETVHGVPLPRGSRAADPAHPADPLFTSGRGFRDTIDHVRRHLRTTGIPHQEIPVYRRGPVTVARFLSRQPGLPWLAIHVFQLTGKTFIAVVPAPAAPPLPPTPSPP